MEPKVRAQIEAAIETHKKMVAEFKANSIETISDMADTIISSLEQGGCVYICGNGGSAADAQHIAGEFVGRFLRERKGLPAIALSTDTSVITSIANDYSYDMIFARQVEALVKEGDILWAISTSGNSANVLSAVELASHKGAKIIGFTGCDGSKLEKLSDVCFCAAAESSFHSQQIHQIAYHIICDLVESHYVK
ncbi:MAG: SIS domain-containing protein [Planctomycetes bacterium]|nr:SIS domain-containing protein [Planctomycetota bacterium]